MLHIKLAQLAVRCALPPRRSESPVCANDNKPSCVLHLLGWFVGSCGFSSLERRPKFWVLQVHLLSDVAWLWGLPSTFLLRRHSILGLLCFPAVPSEAWDVYPRNFSWLTKSSIITANFGNCCQVFHFRDSYDGFVWNSYNQHPNCIPWKLFDSTLVICWVSP